MAEIIKGSIKGLVTGDGNVSLKDIVVTIEGIDDTQTPNPRTVTTSAVADANFKFAELPLGKYTIRFPKFVPLAIPNTGYQVLAEGSTSQPLTLSDLTPNKTANTRTYKIQSATVQGKVTDDQGRPLNGIPVFLVPQDLGGEDVTRNQLTLKVRTKLDGTYALSGLVFGRYTLSFLQETLYRDQVTGKTTITLQKPQKSQVDLTLTQDNKTHTEDATYVAGTAGVPPEVVLQAIIDAREVWTETASALAAAVAAADGLDGYSDQLEELNESAAREADWLDHLQPNVTVQAAPQLYDTLSYRAREKQAVIQGRLNGLGESIDQAVEPPASPDAAFLLALKNKLKPVSEAVVKLNDTFLN